MKLLYLFTIGLLNLGLGWGIAQWLKRQAIGDQPREGNEAGPPAATESAATEPAGEERSGESSPPDGADTAADPATAEQTTVESSDETAEDNRATVSASDEGPSEEANVPTDVEAVDGSEPPAPAEAELDILDAPAAVLNSDETTPEEVTLPQVREELNESPELDSDASESLDRSGDTTNSDDSTGGDASLEAASYEEPVGTTQDGADRAPEAKSIAETESAPDDNPTANHLCDELAAELEEQTTFLEQQLELLAVDQAAEELNEILSRIGDAVQKTLQRLNTTVESLAAAEPSTEMANQIEGCWSDINDKAVRLVTLGSAADDPSAAQHELTKICEGVRMACLEAREKLSVTSV